jgi:ankyrin repeat protein
MATILPDGFLMLVKEGEAEAVAQQLADGFTEINHAEAETGLTASHYAAARNARAIVKLLVATGLCDVTRRDRHGRTAAVLAAEVADNPTLARYLYDLEYRQRGDRAGGEESGAAER